MLSQSASVDEARMVRAGPLICRVFTLAPDIYLRHAKLVLLLIHPHTPRTPLSRQVSVISTMPVPHPPAAPTFDKPLQLPLSPELLSQINDYLRPETPEDILKWAVEHIPGLFQTTAFGLTGLVAIDMLSKITTSPPPLIFVDTLYHFQETYDLVEEVKKKYGVPVTVYKPEGCETVQDFEKKYGEKLWERDEEMYDFAVKVCDYFQATHFQVLTAPSFPG